MRILPARYTRGSMRAYRWLVLAIVSPLLGCDASNPAAPALPEVSEPTDAFVIIITPDVAEVAPGGTVGLSVNITDAESGDPPVDGTSVTITTSAGQLEATNTDPGPLVLVPTIGGVSAPQLGGSYQVELADAPPASLAWHVLGSSTEQWLGLPLPLDLGLFGAGPGCTLYCNAFQITVHLVNGLGTASQHFNIPAAQAHVGKTIFHQWVVVDPLANPLGLVTSPPLASRMGL